MTPRPALSTVKFGRYCNEIWQPRQKRPTSCYNSYKDWKSAPPTDRILDHDDEVAQYRRKEAALYLEGEESLRDAYRALAEHFERGGHIFYGHTAHGVAPGLYDGRSNKRVLKDAGIVEPEEHLFPPAKAQRPDPDKEYRTDTAVRHDLGEVIHGIEADDAPIRETRRRDVSDAPLE
jgi:hypothetical protein